MGYFGGIAAFIVTLATETTWWKVALTIVLGVVYALGFAGNWRNFRDQW